MELLICVLAGLLTGHVLDLTFARLYTEESLSGPLFRCRECRRPLRAIYVLPVLGYALTRGHCRDCGAPLPMSAFVLPIGGAMLFAASFFAFDDLAGGLLGGFFCTVFLTLTLTDLERRLLPNRLVYPSILLAIGLSWAWPDSSIVDVLAGGLVAVAIGVTLLLLSLPFGRGAFGMGDVKMIVLIGFVVGLPSVAVGVFVGTLAAAAAAVVLIALRIRSRTDYIPHGPFLALGAVVALFWGADIWHAYTG
ncbi:MAG TPA: A24 family peptidase [Dehalococcoidia bacterium]|jgi:prepilin signal peptidase PulO-like enzyme (type II secretory pathway)|nr:A24 family peptidase [Dehalococcoidia bacterium]